MPRRRAHVPDEQFGQAATSRAARDEVVIGTEKVAGGRGDIRAERRGPRLKPGSKANPRATATDVNPRASRVESYEDVLLGDRPSRGEMAPLTYAPTRTTNLKKPRTLAAGYNRQTQTLSVIFRDGTAWNYYGVTYQMWTAFKNSPSPGRYIRTRLDFKAYGPPSDAPSAEDPMPTAAELLTRTDPNRMPSAKELLNRSVFDEVFEG